MTATQGDELALKTAADSEDDTWLSGVISESKADRSMKRRLTVVLLNEEKIPEVSSTSTMELLLDATLAPQVVKWMKIKHAFKLLAKGVEVRFRLQCKKSGGAQTDKESSPIHLLQEIRVHQLREPIAQYISRLFLFSCQDLWELFPSDESSKSTSSGNESIAFSSTLLYAVRPLSLADCQHLQTLCHSERTEGRSVTFFKSPVVQEAVKRIRQYHEEREEQHDYDTAPKVLYNKNLMRLRPIRRWDEQALQRIETAWCSDEAITVANDCEKASLSSTHTLDGPIEVFDTVELNNQLTAMAKKYEKQLAKATEKRMETVNLPNPCDQRRITYLDTRKQPQIEWMIRRILRLVGCEYVLRLRETETMGQSSSSTRPPKTLKVGNNSSSNDRAVTRAIPQSKTTSTAFHENSSKQRKRTFLDIGGGRGDLAVALALVLQQDCENQYHILVVDNNERSLKAGKQYAEEKGVSDIISFVLADVGELLEDDTPIHSALQERGFVLQPNGTPKLHECLVDVVYGLHCCGGLSEAAIRYAISGRSTVPRFCVVTCCFRSNFSLSSLTKHAENLVETKRTTVVDPKSLRSSSNSEEVAHAPINKCGSALELFRDDIQRVSFLATGSARTGQHRAIRALNAVRRVAAQDLYCKEIAPSKADPSKERLNGTNNPSTTSEKPRKLLVWQEHFPVQFSIQNRVLLGSLF